MGFGGDERGQAIQIGAILIFATLVISFSYYQAFLVPNQNADIEYQHSRDVTDDMKQVRSAILNVGGTGTTQSETVDLGTEFPSRLLAVNPPPPSGSLRTAAEGQVEFNRSFNVSNACGYTGTARSFVYNPAYSEYQEAPIIGYDNSVVYRNHSGQIIVDTNQTLIQDNTIQITPLNASYDVSGTQRVTLTFKGGPANGTVETLDSGLNITIPTRIPAETWETNDKLFGDVDSVKAVRDAEEENAVNVTLREDTYTLACRAVGIGKFPASGAATPPGIDDSGYGQGSTETYDPNDPESETLSTKGGALKGIVNASHIVLEQPDFAPTKASDASLQQNRRYLRVGWKLKNASVGTEDARRYYFVIGSKEGIRYDYSASGVSWQSYNVYLYEEDEDENVEKLIDGKNLDESQLDSWLKNGEKIDLLNEVNYEDSSAVESDLDDLQSFLNNSEKTTLIVTNVHGRVTVNVTNEVATTTGGTVSADNTKVVYKGTSGSNLKTVNTSNVVETYSTSEPNAVGPLNADLGVGDADGDIPFKGNNNGYLRGVATDDTVDTLDSTQILDAPMGVGDWDEDGYQEVLYAHSNNELHEYEVGTQTVTTITDNSGSAVTVAAVAGVADIDGDTNDEVVFVGNQNTRLKYLGQSGNNPTTISNDKLSNVGSATAVSTPADFDGDNDVEVAVYDGADSGIDLYDSGGQEVSYDPSPSYDVQASPMAAEDWRNDGDGSPDLILVDGNNKLRYLDWTGKNEAIIQDSNSNDVTATAGVVGVR